MNQGFRSANVAISSPHANMQPQSMMDQLDDLMSFCEKSKISLRKLFFLIIVPPSMRVLCQIQQLLYKKVHYFCDNCRSRCSEQCPTCSSKPKQKQSQSMIIKLDQKLLHVVMFHSDIKRVRGRNLIGEFVWVEIQGNIVRNLQFVFKGGSVSSRMVGLSLE